MSRILLVDDNVDAVEATALVAQRLGASGADHEGDDARLAAAGIDQFLRKPVDLAFLRSLLGKADFNTPVLLPSDELRGGDAGESAHVGGGHQAGA